MSILRLVMRVRELNKELGDVPKKIEAVKTARDAVESLGKATSAVSLQLDKLIARDPSGNSFGFVDRGKKGDPSMTPGMETWFDDDPTNDARQQGWGNRSDKENKFFGGADQNPFGNESADWYGESTGGFISDDYVLDLIKQYAGRLDVNERLARGEGTTADRAKLPAMNKIGMARLEALFEKIFGSRFGSLKDLAIEYRKRLAETEDALGTANADLGVAIARAEEAERELAAVVSDLRNPLSTGGGLARYAPRVTPGRAVPPSQRGAPSSRSSSRTSSSTRPASSSRVPAASTGRYRA